MPETRYPGAAWDPGRAAGYGLRLAVPPYSDHNDMRAVGCHYTVGVNSWALIRDMGLAAFLITRNGRVGQFCEVDAVTYQAGNPFNGLGPGIEIEWYEPHDGPDIFTDAARNACAVLIAWLHAEWGIPLDYREDGPRVADWHGFIAHRAVIEDADNHTDYWPQADWDAMTAAPAPAPHPLEDDMPIIIRVTGEPPKTLLVTDDEVYEVNGLTTANVVCDQAQADYIVNDVRAKFKQKNP